MGWNTYYDDISDFVLKHAPNRVAVEIGTAFGGMADLLLQRVPDLELHVVDPFLAGYDPNDATSQMYVQLGASNGMNNSELSKIYAQAMAFDLGNVHYGCRYHLHHAKSTEAAPAVKDHSVGAIFVDGLHTQAGVEADIATWVPKMVKGGLMIFNDYGSANFPGIKVAVDKLAASFRQEIKYIGASGKEAGNVYVEIQAAERPSLSLASLLPSERKDISKICQDLSSMPSSSDCKGTPPARVTFAILVISDAYVPGALCLVHQLASSKYPVTVLHDGVSPEYLKQLSSAAANVQQVSLSELARSRSISFSNFSNGTSNTGLTAEWSSMWFSRTHSKFFYWLLEYDWVVALDIDMLPLGTQGLDELMNCGGEGKQLAAVPMLPQDTGNFNSGLLGLKPSVATFQELQQLTVDATSGKVKVPKVFETQGISDQSILNHKFAQTYRPLPKSFNMERRWWRWCSGPSDASENLELQSKLLKNTRILHFVGDYKPWGTLKEPDPLLFRLGGEWTRQCQLGTEQGSP
jgi:lipopolysaccharide biosynthesis glycosyltransferase